MRKRCRVTHHVDGHLSTNSHCDFVNKTSTSFPPLQCLYTHEHTLLQFRSAKSMSSERVSLLNYALLIRSDTPVCLKSSFFSFYSPFLLPLQIGFFRVRRHIAKDDSKLPAQGTGSQLIKIYKRRT